jgi:hypothetical protein
MLDMKDDGRLQVTAAASLLDNSRLVEWEPHSAQFVPVPQDCFEFSWRRDVDPDFGRLICWISFSAGTEFLAKGVCLVNGIDIRKKKYLENPNYPTEKLNEWADRFNADWKCGGTISSTDFGTLRDLIGENAKDESPLKRLCKLAKATAIETNLVWAAYRLLAKTIRNRDAHAYVPNVRDSHHSLVPDLFSGVFNLLVTWLPNGKGTLNEWRRTSGTFISSLPTV